MTEPAWHPDPTGRNHYRWWDGTQWTDSVSNHGQVGVDPMQPALPAQPQTQPQALPTPGAVQPRASATAPTKSPWKIVVPVVTALAVAAVLFVVFGRGDSGGGGGRFGVIDVDLPRRTSVATFDYTLKKGEVLRVRAEPDDELIAVFGFVTDRATARRYAEALNEAFADLGFDFEDSLQDAEDLFSDSDLGALASSRGFDSIPADGGSFGADFFVAFVDGTYTLVVGTTNNTSGSVRMVVEKFSKTMPVDRFEAFSDFDEFLADEADFFSDARFFSSERPFRP